MHCIVLQKELELQLTTSILIRKLLLQKDNMLEYLSKETLHHTNICIGNKEVIIEDINLLISNLSKVIKKVNQVVYAHDQLLIDDVKFIFKNHLYKVGEDEIQVICISFNSTNRESQNSILKVLEEPPRNTYFFLIIPNKNNILQTVLSRSQIFEYKKEIIISKDTQKFITGSITERLEFIKKKLDDLKLEKITKQNIIDFVEEIEKYVHEQKNIILLKRIVEIKGYMRDQGASSKQLLEYLAVQI